MLSSGVLAATSRPSATYCINSSLGMRLVGTYNVQQRHIKRFSPAGNESELQVTTVAVI